MSSFAPALQTPSADFTFSPAIESLHLDVVVTRGPMIESRHRVHAAVVNANGDLLFGARNPHFKTWWRSCAKPFQVMPFLESGHFDALAWGEDELALACASHGGEPEHVAIAERMLVSIGLEAGDLACGPHEPLAARGARVLRESGHPLTRLHNNCSGKHSAMLARAVRESWPIEGYERLEHPVQDAAADTVSKWSGYTRSSLAYGVDGCGVTVFGLPLANMALAYARLVQGPAQGGGQEHTVPTRIISAMTQHPFLVGGTDRFDTVLMEACQGRVLCKIGAEGVHTLGLVSQGIGIAIKVEDGGPRAQFPAVMAVLDALGELPADMPDVLRELQCKSIRNTRGEDVGEIRVVAISEKRP